MLLEEVEEVGVLESRHACSDHQTRRSSPKVVPLEVHPWAATTAADWLIAGFHYPATFTRLLVGPER